MLDSSIIKPYYLASLGEVCDNPKDYETDQQLMWEADGLGVLQESALKQYPEGSACYTQLKAIADDKKATDEHKRESFKEQAATSAIAARLILSHDELWSFIQDPEERATFIHAVMGDWRDAICCVLDTPALRTEWLVFFKNLTPKKISSTIQKLLLAEQKHDTIFKPMFWSFSKHAELQALLSRAEPEQLSSHLTTILNADNNDSLIASIWAEQAALLPLLSMLEEGWELAQCIEYIFDSLSDNSLSMAELWSQDSDRKSLIMKLAQMEEIEDRDWLKCGLKILKAGKQAIALLWSQDSKWRAFFGSIIKKGWYGSFYAQVNYIVSFEEAAKVWVSTPELSNMIAQLPERSYRLKCIQTLLTTLSKAKVMESGFLDNPTLKADWDHHWKRAEEYEYTVQKILRPLS